MKCSVKRNALGKIQSVNTQDGQPSLLYKQLVKYYEGNKELALAIYAKTLDNSYPAGHLNTQGEAKLQYALNQPVKAYDQLFSLSNAMLDDVPTGISRYMAFVQNEITAGMRRLAQINVQKRNKITDDLILEEERIRNRLYGDKAKEGDQGLVELAEQLEKQKFITGIDVIAQKDLARLEHVSKSKNSDDMQEAERLADFYIAVADFSDPNNHPLLERDEIIDEHGNFIVEDLVVVMFNNYRDQAEAFIRNINTSQQEMLMNMYRNSAIRSRLGDLTYDDLIEKDGLKDATWFDSMFMDMSKGVASHNGVLPQLIHENIQNSITTERGRGQFHNGMNLTEISKVLSDKGRIVQQIDPTFNVLLELDEQGSRTGELINRTDAGFRQELQRIHKAFNTAVNQSRTKGLREQAGNYRRRNNLINQIGQVLDVTRVPELAATFSRVNDLPELQLNFEGDEDYRDELIDQIGQDNYNAFIAEQTEKLENFIEEYRARRQAAEEKAVALGGRVSPEDQRALHVFIVERSPVQGYSSYSNGGPLQLSFAGGDRVIIDNHLSNNVIIPNADQLNDRFEAVRSNPDILAMYEAMSSILDVMYRVVPDRIRSQITPSSLLTSSMVKKAGRSFSELSSRSGIWDSFVQGVTVREETTERSGIMNLITGDFSPEVAFQLQSNEAAINKRFNEFKELFNSKRREDEAIQIILDKNSIAHIDLLSLDQRQMIAEAYNVGADPASIRALGDGTPVIPVGMLMFNHIRRSILDKQQFDLPQLGKYLAASIVDYRAKQEVVPDMLVLRKAYQSIKAPSTNNMGSFLRTLTNQYGQSEKIMKGERERAKAQFDAQMERVLQVNFNQDTTKKNFGSFGERVLTTDEKKRRDEIDELLESDKIGDERKESLREEREELGERKNAEQIVQSIINFQRFVSLAYNLGSGVTNAVEGFVSNFIAASKGEYFKPDLIFDAIAITKMSIGSRLHGSSTARKLKVIMDRYALVQDSTNEFQKADYDKSGLLSTGLDILKPYYTNRKVEYFNQAQLIVAKMLDTPVISADGLSSTNAWEALNEDGVLREEYRTPQNIETWENVRSEAYKEWKNDTNAMIETHHGNYDPNRGMKAKDDSVVFRAVLMFKTFMTNQFFIRYGVRQPYAEGADRKEFKGYYRSLSPVSGAMSGATAGLVTLGPLGALIGGGVGFAAGMINNVQTDVGLIEELAVLGKAFVRKAAGIPINMFGAAIGAGRFVTTDTRDTFRSAGFNQQDAQNMSAVMTELAWLMNTVMMYMIAQMYWDDDDDRKAGTYKYAINTLGQYINQVTAYTSPTATANNATSIAAVTLMENIAKFAKALGTALSDEDTITTGQYKGQSKIGRSTQKLFIPKVAIPTLNTDGISGWFGSDAAQQVYTHNMIQGIYQKTDEQEEKAKKRAKKAKLKPQPKE